MIDVGWMHLKIFGDKAAVAKLARAERAAVNMKPALREILWDIRRVIEINFTSQGRRGGGSWKALDPVYVERKVSRGLDHRILIARGRLMDSWTKPYSRNKVEEITNSSLMFDSLLPYSATQNEGDEDRNIPARPFIAFIPSDRTHWVNIVEDHLMEALRA